MGYWSDERDVQIRRGCLKALPITLLHPRSPYPGIHVFVVSLSGVMNGPLQEDPTDRLC